MEWFNKEFSFEQRTRKSGNLWQYVPAKKSIGVNRAFTDSDGYWIELAEGWTAYDGGEDCGIIHEYTISDLRDAIKTIRKQ